MGALSKHLRNVAGGGLAYWCQGCKEAHVVWVGEGPGPRWTWNGDVEKPVFGPSVLVRWSVPPPREPDDPPDHVCHTFIGCNGAQPGEVIFLGDCTHALAGQVLPLPEMPAMRSHEA